METIIPVNYLPVGREKIKSDGFGYVTNKHQYDWLNDNSISSAIHNDILKKLQPGSQDNTSSQKILKNIQDDIYNTLERALNERNIESWSNDVYRDENIHQKILNFQV